VSTSEDIIQAFRAAIMAVNTLTDHATVRPWGVKGPKNDLPFVTVRVTTPGRRVGFDDVVRIIDTVPKVYAKGEREAVVSLQWFGETAYTWLENFVASLNLPSTLDVFAPVGGSTSFDVEPLNDPVDLSQLLETSYDARGAWDFTVNYSVTTATTPGSETQTEALTVVEDDRTVASPPTNIVTEVTHTL